MQKHKVNGRVSVLGTIKLHTPRIKKSKKEDAQIKRSIQRAKRAKMDARLARFW